MRTHDQPLSLEILEARALFAGELLDAAVQFDEVLQALDTTSKISASFDPNAPAGVYRLMLVGDSNAMVTIDFDKLPSFVTSINVSKFDSVTFEGKDWLVNLIASDVNSIKAPEINIIGVFEATNVDYIEIKSVSGYAAIQGDRVVAHIDNFSAINLTLNVTTLLLETEALPKQITFWNTKTVIALPNVPSSWDLSPFSGLEDKESQLRIGSSDVTTGVIDIAQTPQQPVVFSTDLHVRALLDRLEVLFNQTGGFDVTVIKRIVAELDHVQETVGSTVIPEMIMRREFSSTFAIEQPTSVKFSPSLNASVEVIVDPSQLTASLPLADGNSNNVIGSYDAPIILIGSPALPMSADDTTRAAVQVTIDPAAEVGLPQPTVWGIISQLVERGMDLKQYLIDQLTQEIVPGERAGVLLVDPKPVRGAHNPRLSE